MCSHGGNSSTIHNLEGVGGKSFKRSFWNMVFQPSDHTISSTMVEEYGSHVRIIEHVKSTYKGRLDCFNGFLDQNWKETRIIEYMENKDN